MRIVRLAGLSHTRHHQKTYSALAKYARPHLVTPVNKSGGSRAEFLHSLEIIGHLRQTWTAFIDAVLR